MIPVRAFVTDSEGVTEVVLVDGLLVLLFGMADALIIEDALRPRG